MRLHDARALRQVRAVSMSACEGCASLSGGIYIANCRACTVRMIARSLPRWESARLGRISDAYKASLVRAFGDGWQAGHAEVKAAAC